MRTNILFSCLFLFIFNLAACGGNDEPRKITINATDSRCFSGEFDKDGDGFPDGKLFIGAGCDRGALRGGPFDCDDSNPNVNPNASERCNGVDDDCDGTADGGLTACTCVPGTACNDGQFCTQGDTCVATSSIASMCQAGTAPVCTNATAPICDEQNDRCVACVSNTQCNDGAFCNGAETCNVAAGTCTAGTPPNVDDGIVCTVDTCNEATDTVANTPSDARCNDGAFCNGVETCNATLGCRAGTPPVVNDGDACTSDSCNENTDAVVNAEIPGCCNDNSDCPMGVCTSMTATIAGMCVGCAMDNDCTQTSVCQGGSCFACVAGNACQTASRHPTQPGTCLNTQQPDCCLGSQDDVGCMFTVNSTVAFSSENTVPANLPAGFVWGCSNAATSTETVTGYQCTSAEDTDMDGFFEPENAAGNCADGWDNDGDGLVDANDPDCQTAPSGCPANAGVWFRKTSAGTHSILHGGTLCVGSLQEQTNPTFGQDERIGSAESTGRYWRDNSITFAEWAGQTRQQRLDWCVGNYVCELDDGRPDFLPNLTPDSTGNCECGMDGRRLNPLGL